jgi:signal transduction histidine kinase
LLLNRQVLLRLTRLSHAVYRIEHGQDTVRQVPVEGRDELTSLSVAINNMLTALGRSESALAEARDQALEASRFKSQLLASVSHDLRSPLNAILGYAEILGEEIEGPLADEHQEMIRRIITSAGHLLALINNLLNEAQLEAGKITLSIASFPPDELLESVQMTMLILAQAKGLTLRGEVDPDLPARLSGDAHWLRQIAMNLVSNAIKFTEQGEVCIRLYCVDETHWALQVADTGRGIPPEARTAIFEAFRQVEGTTDRTKGFGLGLSIVNQLTFLMGGQIQLESEVNAGSAFTIILPLTPGDELT